MKRILIFIFFYSLSFGRLFAEIQTDPFVGGNGSQENPYQISNLSQLKHLSETPSLWSSHFELVNDIDASQTKTWNEGKGFSPIGKGDGKNAVSFLGSFNGNYHSIDRIYINRPLENYIGLFGLKGNDQTSIQKLGLTNVDIIGYKYVGGLVGSIHSHINECFVTGKVEGNSAVGGLVGDATDSNITKVYTNVLTKVNGGKFTTVGGIIGDLSGESSLSEAYAYGRIEKDRLSQYGGLIGNKRDAAFVQNSYWDKEKTTVLSSKGSVDTDGLNTTAFGLENNFSTWDFEKTWEIKVIRSIDSNPRPYLKGFIYDAFISIRSYPTGAISESEQAYVYGDQVQLDASENANYQFVKWTDKNGNEISTEKNHNFILDVSSPKIYIANYRAVYSFDAGDGTKVKPYEISTLEQLRSISNLEILWDKHFILLNNINAKETITWNNGKGFSPIGNNRSQSADRKFIGSIDGNGHSIKNLYINRPEENYVGLIGVSYYDAQIRNLALENVNIKGANYVGGLAGEYKGKIMRSFVTGSVEGKQNVGGLSGEFSSSDKIQNTYSTAHVKGDENVGGLVGLVSNKINISLSYASGFVQGNKYAGGLIGYVDKQSNFISQSYWNKDLTRQSSSAGSSTLEALTSKEMADKSNFIGWDFENVWKMSPENRPELKWKIEQDFLHLSSETTFGGIISPNQASVAPGTKTDFKITANKGFEVYEVFVDGQSVGKVNSYSFENIQNNHRITATFVVLRESEPETYKITTIARTGGKITESVELELGASKTFDISPEENYKIKEVIVDGKIEATQSSYTFENVSSDHSIVVSFQAKNLTNPSETYSITSFVSNEGGSITESKLVNEGSDATFEIKVKDGYEIMEVLVNGKNVGKIKSYTFNNVNESQSILVRFQELKKVLSKENPWEFVVYPNPTFRDLKLKNLKQGLIIRLVNSNAKLILEEISKSGDNLLDLARVEKGIYFLQIESYKTQKIIKK